MNVEKKEFEVTNEYDLELSRPSRYDVLRTMKTGESFAVSLSEGSFARIHAKKLDIPVTVRKVGEDQYRLWRL